ncbi:MAG: tetraacyldisaccharide 4'-kinase, partial [Gemmatimonadaceae bacterium]|nr:tetraacyldisaccharide 4'-kinase [Gemmatimonadaceae bacterium]
GGDTVPSSTLAGERVLAISAVGDPGAFAAQLLAAGAAVEPQVFPDHHHFTAADVDRLAARAARCARAVCTLKDAVKLAPLWPRQATSLWYVSQQMLVESGRPNVDALVDAVLGTRIRQP